MDRIPDHILKDILILAYKESSFLAVLSWFAVCRRWYWMMTEIFSTQTTWTVTNQRNSCFLPLVTLTSIGGRDFLSTLKSVCQLNLCLPAMYITESEMYGMYDSFIQHRRHPRYQTHVIVDGNPLPKLPTVTQLDLDAATNPTALKRILFSFPNLTTLIYRNPCHSKVGDIIAESGLKIERLATTRLTMEVALKLVSSLPHLLELDFDAPVLDPPHWTLNRFEVHTLLRSLIQQRIKSRPKKPLILTLRETGLQPEQFFVSVPREARIDFRLTEAPLPRNHRVDFIKR